MSSLEGTPSRQLAMDAQHIALRTAMGEVLTEHRKKFGIKLKDIAEETGLTVSTVSKIISATNTPIMFANLDAICTAVRLPSWELFLRASMKMSSQESDLAEAMITLVDHFLKNESESPSRAC